ncbi:MAG TPA: glycosyltransferase family 2 protein [Flavobacterium sp.]|jgi:hypothetical protein
MKTAVVILNWNGRKLLEQFLPTIIRFSAEADIYVADNASDDDSVAYVRGNFPSVKIIENSTNLGFAGGYNQALANVEADIYALVNSDVLVTENWLLPILECLRNEPDTAIIQPKIKDYKNPEYFEYAGAAGGFVDRFGYPFCRGRVFDTVEKDEGQYDDDREIFWASGACMFIRKNVFDELGGFDADFFAHQEEIDLCWRAFNKGFKAKYIHNSVVYHVGGATLQQGDPRKTYLNFRNSLMMLVKNLPGKQLITIVIGRMVLDGMAGIQFLLKGKPAHFWAIIKAHFAFYSAIRHNYLKRIKSKAPGQYFHLSSVVYNYFVGGKKYYKNLF